MEFKEGALESLSTQESEQQLQPRADGNHLPELQRFKKGPQHSQQSAEVFPEISRVVHLQQVDPLNHFQQLGQTVVLHGGNSVFFDGSVCGFTANTCLLATSIIIVVVEKMENNGGFR